MTPPRPLRLGLVGQGIRHSLSPILHTRALELAVLTGSYTIFDCADDTAARAVFAQLRSGELDGLNVTTPFKALALQSADAWQRTAHHKAGVFTQPANTLFMLENNLVAASTDGAGLGAALLSAQVDLVGKRVLLLGVGGAGQAVAAEVLSLGAAQLRIANRSPTPAVALAERLNTIWPKHAVPQTWGDPQGLVGIDVVLQATRLGHGQPPLPAVLSQVAADLDWLPWTAWAKHQPLLADLVYAGDMTPVQALALQRGLRVDNRLTVPPIDFAQIHPALPYPSGILKYFGQAMLAHQAARSFALWTGRPVDAVRMLAAILPSHEA